MGANRHLEVFEQGAMLVEKFGPDRLQKYFASEYFGDNADRDELNAPNDDFSAAKEVEDLLALNATWLRKHPGLCPLPTEEDMRREARRRGEALPDREHRAAEALANEWRYMKLIRALCAQAGQELQRVTAGDPDRVHDGTRTMAWYFITDQGPHHNALLDEYLAPDEIATSSGSSWAMLASKTTMASCGICPAMIRLLRHNDPVP